VEKSFPTGVQVIARDVTERKRLEMQLPQSQKMEAIGLLAGGVAHDFNTLLGVICGQCKLISLQSNLDDGLRTRIEEIAKAAQRAAELTRQLLAFSRKQLLQLNVLDLNAAVTDMAAPLRRLIGEHVTLVTRLAPDLGRIKADPSQIEQVIINLAVNARDAMPQGGTLILETANQELDEEFARHNPLAAPGWYVMLTVSDTGVGIDKESMAHIFEPFYTTKEMGKGTGLGLATVYGMIKQSGGHIAVHRVPGRGATFAIYFPLVAGEAQTEKSEVRPLTATPRKETILLVEDEATLRELVRTCLQQAGYTVLVAEDGYEAMEIASRHPGEIDLLLTDVVMPGLSGLEVARRLREQRPQTKVLYVSGYLDAATLAPESLGPGAAFLEKPFRLQALTRKLLEVLGHKPD